VFDRRPIEELHGTLYWLSIALDGVETQPSLASGRNEVTVSLPDPARHG
jgi:hypothetical protein